MHRCVLAKILRTYLVGVVLAGISLMPVLVAVWYCGSQAIIYYQTETALQQDHLETIILTTAEITWLKAGKEILLGDLPFDVKKVHRIGDKTMITGLYDHKEKALKEKLRKLNRDDMQHNSQVKFTTPFILFTPTAGVYFTGLCLGLKGIANYISYNQLFMQFDYSWLTTPPPRCTYYSLGLTHFAANHFTHRPPFI